MEMSGEVRVHRAAGRKIMDQESEDRENQLTNQYIEPHKDIKKERPHVFVPGNKVDKVSLDHREESLLPPNDES